MTTSNEMISRYHSWVERRPLPEENTFAAGEIDACVCRGSPNLFEPDSFVKPERCKVLGIDHAEDRSYQRGTVTLVDYFPQQTSSDPSSPLRRHNGEPANKPFWLPPRLDHERLSAAVPNQLTIAFCNDERR